MGLSGNLKTVSFSDILQLLATGKKSGLLEVRTAKRQKEVYFRDGNIIYASSVNSSEDLLGNMLLKRGKISKSDLERAVVLHKKTGRQLGSTLVDMNIFSKDEIAECLTLQIEEIVYNLFSWPEGDFIFYDAKAPQNANFLVELSTMSVIMEGTRRIDEWLEIQKVLPSDDAMLALSSSPQINSENISLSVDEFKLLSKINGERTMPELVDVSPMGEFVTYRAIYKLILSQLVVVVGKKEEESAEQVDEEEEILKIIFDLYNNCFYRIRTLIEEMVGEENTRFSEFAAQYRTGLTTYFSGLDPTSEVAPPFEKFATETRTIPNNIRFYVLMSGLEKMLSEQLEYVFQLLGIGAYKEVVVKVKKEISAPLAMKRELVKKYKLEENFYRTVRSAEKVVKMVRG